MLSHILFLYLLAVSTALDLIHSKRYYQKGESVDLLLNKIESDHTQLPYRYHDLPFVCHDKTKRAKTPSLGEVLKGDRLWESNYQLRFGEDIPCARLCDMSATPKAISWADSLIRKGYVVHWVLDGLPGATTFQSSNSRSKYYAAGFPLGFVQNDVSYYYNHVLLVVRYHVEQNGLYSIVGFEVYPKSVIDESCPGSSKNFKNFPLHLKDSSGNPKQDRTLIPYTYAVYWREDKSVSHENRWDLYYENDNSATSRNIHWISLVNSIVLVCLVSLVVAVVLVRFLRTDLKASPLIPTAEVKGEPASYNLWQSLSNVAIQKPMGAFLLSCLCAAGVQTIIAMMGVVVIFVLNSKLSLGSGTSSSIFFENHQSAVFSTSLLFLLASGYVSAYIGIILHKLLSNEHPNTQFPFSKICRLGCFFAGGLPLSLLTAILFINLFVWAKESSNALPFGTIVVLILMFTLIQIPLGILGSFHGNKFTFLNKSCFINSYSPPDKGFVKRNSNKTLFFRPVLSVIAFGLIPFGIVYVDLLFIFNSVWLEKTTFYYMYGFLLLTTVLLLIVVAESTIVATYITLSVFKNPDWQWLCFQVGSSIGWYIYAYTTYYFIRYLLMSDIVSVLIYFAYMALVSAAVGVAGGAVGVITATIFIRKIYGAIKMD